MGVSFLDIRDLMGMREQDRDTRRKGLDQVQSKWKANTCQGRDHGIRVVPPLALRLSGQSFNSTNFAVLVAPFLIATVFTCGWYPSLAAMTVNGLFR